MDGILPAAGSATRMRGMPKFLLPCSISYETLLEKHIDNLLKYCEVVWVPTRPELVGLIHSLGYTSDRVVVVALSSKSMTETVLKIAKISNSESFMLCMPDTFFYGDLPYMALSTLDSDVNLACWKIREEQMGKLGQVKFHASIDNKGKIVDSRDKDPKCTFEYSWGAMAFNRKFLGLGNPEMPHVGYIINPAIQSGLDVQGFKVSGEYFDCGTPTEYLQLVGKTLSE
jgi:hypothetical protein